MELEFTNGSDPRFAAMCLELDAYLNDMAGGETQRKHYVQYNTPSAVTDVGLLLEDGQAIACAGFKHFNESTAEIKRVYTHPRFRGKGCARTLMTALEERAARRGYARLVLETGRMMEPAIRFYTGIGFQQTENYGQYRDLPESVCMEKHLVGQPAVCSPGQEE